MPQARKRPIVIDYHNYNNLEELKAWVEEMGDNFFENFDVLISNGTVVKAKTLKGPSYIIESGDVVIRGFGEYYPCRKDVFDLNYDLELFETVNAPFVNTTGVEQSKNIVTVTAAAGKGMTYTPPVKAKKEKKNKKGSSAHPVLNEEDPSSKNMTYTSDETFYTKEEVEQIGDNPSDSEVIETPTEFSLEHLSNPDASESDQTGE